MVLVHLGCVLFDLCGTNWCMFAQVTGMELPAVWAFPLLACWLGHIRTMLKPSIVFDFFNQTVACRSLFIAYNVNVWMMLPSIQVILAELCRLQPSWIEQSWFVSWREGGTLCLRGFFSVNSNDGAELSPHFSFHHLICVLLCPLEDWAGHIALRSATSGGSCSGSTEEKGAGLYYMD